MKLRLLVLTTLALLLTLVVPATAADAAGGGDWWQKQCPSGFDGPDKDGNCTKVTIKEFDADEVIKYYCEAPYAGPDANNECSKIEVKTFPADPVYDFKCPDGYDGPVNGICSKKITTIDTVHVNEESRQVCPDGWNLDTDVCSIKIPEITTSTSTTVTEYSCPADYAGPNTANQCVKAEIVIDVKDAVVTVNEICPTDFTISSANCVRTEPDVQFAGVVRTVDLGCPAELAFTAAGCVAVVPAKLVVSCIDGYTLNDENGTVYPGTCEQASNTTPVVYSLDCPAPLTNLVEVMLGMGTCESVSSPHDVISYACPSGFTLVINSNTLCEQDSTRQVVVPPVQVEVKSCDEADYVGPGINDECTKTTFVDDVIDATATDVEVCTGDAVGPNVDGDCLTIGTTLLTTPAIDLPSFTCPAGYDGPDAKWNCTKEVTKVDEVDAEEVVKGYICPSDARGPNGDALCARDNVVTIDASKDINYVCPDDTHGPVDGICTRKHVEVVPAAGTKCYVKFYDFPHAQKLLFATSNEGAVNLSGKLSHFNNDVESIKVPAGCTVSVARKYDAAYGWCKTLGEGVHNLPDDQLSWFAIPGTGCDTKW